MSLFRRPRIIEGRTDVSIPDHVPAIGGVWPSPWLPPEAYVVRSLMDLRDRGVISDEQMLREMRRAVRQW